MKMRFSFLVVLFFVMSLTMVRGQNFEWAKSVGGTGSDGGTSIVADNFGNSYITGYFQNTVDFDPGPGMLNLTSSANSSVFIEKLDSSGSLIWAKKTGGSSATSDGASISADPLGNIYILGNFSGTADFDPGPGIYNLTSAGSNDIFIEKFSNAGNFIWAKRIGGTSFDRGNTVTVDNNGNSFIIGAFLGTMDADPGPGLFNLISLGGFDAFIEKLDSSGNLVWAKRMGGSSDDIGNSIKTDAQSNVYSTGKFKGAADLDPGAAVYNLTSIGGFDIFVQKLDLSGNLLWAKGMGGLQDEWGNSISVDSFCNVYIGGSFKSTVDFDPGAGTLYLTSPGVYFNGFIQKLDSLGNLKWAKNIGGSLEDYVSSIKIAGHSDVYITGAFMGSVDFDSGLGIDSASALGGFDVYIEKFDSSGSFVWVKNFGSTSDDFGNYFDFDYLGGIYITGQFQDTTDFNSGSGIFNLPSKGLEDCFVEKLFEDPCSFLSLKIDSASDVLCSQLGYAGSSVSGAFPPYAFQWNTIPVINDSVASFNSNGIYQVTITDANNCIRQREVLINGPNSISSFDLDANLISTTFRPGISSHFVLDAFNDGCVPTSGTLLLIMDNLVKYKSSNPLPDYISGDTLFWNLPTLIYDSTHFVVSIFDSTSTSALIGDSVCFKLLVTPVLGDADTSNNSKMYCFPVKNGYDPNEKNVYPQGVCTPHFINNNQRLTYTVRFQNTGNSNAVNINIIDSLDTDLNINSVSVKGHSHPLITEVLPGNVLKFRFDNIMLPDSGANEILSHGYVIYEVDPLPSLAYNTQIDNKAFIYFDFNPAIVTNTVSNTVVNGIPGCLTLENNSIISNSSMNLFPNPANNFFTIENISSNSTIKIYDFSGRLVMTQKAASTKCIVSTNNLQNGIFLVEVVSDGNGERSFQRVVVNR